MMGRTLSSWFGEHQKEERRERKKLLERVIPEKKKTFFASDCNLDLLSNRESTPRAKMQQIRGENFARNPVLVVAVAKRTRLPLSSSVCFS